MIAKLSIEPYFKTPEEYKKASKSWNSYEWIPDNSQTLFNDQEIVPGMICDKCGNLVIESDSDEECDDGNQVNGDGCSKTCEVEDLFYCEQDNGSIICAVCGDGRLDSIEECDDGDLIDGDGCDSGCEIENNYVCSSESGEQSICARCGDGLVNFPEECDDKNTVNTDGCDNTCKVKKHYQCSFHDSDVPQSVCLPACGDGVKISPETCDDGNLNSNDGCSKTCTTESGYSCSKPLDSKGQPILDKPDICTPVC